MVKTKTRPSLRKEHQAIARVKSMRVSPLKLNLVAGVIRKAKVQGALVQLEFMKKRIAKEVKDCLESAIANAENNHNMNIDNLFISEVLVGKSLVMKRIRARARGRSARILKPFSNLTIILEENKG
jgi:large subunit ribosomal protein L22